MNPYCQCSDPGCPACRGKCLRKAITCVNRIDMEDRTGTPMCNKCATDALESGLFIDKPWNLRFHQASKQTKKETRQNDKQDKTL